MPSVAYSSCLCGCKETHHHIKSVPFQPCTQQAHKIHPMPECVYNTIAMCLAPKNIDIHILLQGGQACYIHSVLHSLCICERDRTCRGRCRGQQVPSVAHSGCLSGCRTKAHRIKTSPNSSISCVELTATSPTQTAVQEQLHLSTTCRVSRFQNTELKIVTSSSKHASGL